MGKKWAKNVNKLNKSFSFYPIYLTLATNLYQELKMCTTQFSHGSVGSLWSYGPFILQKWAKNVNKVNNFFNFQPIYLILVASMDLEWQVCKTQFSHESFLSLRSYVPLILQDWPNMLLHKLTPSVSTRFISYLPQT